MNYISKENSSIGYSYKICLNNNHFFIGINDKYIYFYTAYNPNNGLKEKVFEIDKKCDILFWLFEELYNDIKYSKIYENEEKNSYIRNINKYSDRKLFYNNMIDYHSDYEKYNEAARLLIYFKDGKYYVKFVKGSRNFNEFNVKIYKVASRYKYYYIAFLKMYYKLDEVMNEDNIKVLKKE